MSQFTRGFVGSENEHAKRGTAPKIFVGYDTKLLAEMAVAIALSTVLSFLKFSIWPQGGSVTAGSMVPLFWFCLRRGTKMGISAGFMYGIVQFVVQPSIIYHPAQFILDYPLAFGALGFAGLFQKKRLFGVALGIAGRFFSHFMSGIIFQIDTFNRSHRSQADEVWVGAFQASSNLAVSDYSLFEYLSRATISSCHQQDLGRIPPMAYLNRTFHGRMTDWKTYLGFFSALTLGCVSERD